MQQMPRAIGVGRTVHLDAAGQEMPCAADARHPGVAQAVGMEQALRPGLGFGIHDAGIVQKRQAFAVLNQGEVNAVSQLGRIDRLLQGLTGVVQELHTWPPS